MVLVVFLSSFVHLESLAYLIPWVVAFNAAMVGYSLMDKARHLLRQRRQAAVLAGLLTGGMAYCALNLFYFFTTGLWVFGLLDLAVFLGCGAAFGLGGALLALKYFQRTRTG